MTMDSAPGTIIQKNVILLGAGNAHLQFVKMLGMKPMPGVAVTLVSEASTIPYSAMVPGHIAGEYALSEITIDLVRLCRSVNVRFLADRAVRIDAVARKVHFADRPELAYDVLSLGLGSALACPIPLKNRETSWPIRPLHRLVQRLTALEQQLRNSPAPFHLVVVGGGASGCELTLAIRRRFANFPHFRLTLLQSADRLLPQFPEKAGRIFSDMMHAQAVAVRCGARVIGGDEQSLQLADGERLACDAVLWATNAAAPELLASSGLALDPNGFLLVTDSLQSVTDPAVFGTGDCITLRSHPDLLKNGVYAVRQGGVLFDNIRNFLHDRPLQPFRPQRLCLCLMTTSDGSAIFTYGRIAWKSRLTRRLKERIDRRWIERFTQFPAMSQGDPEDTTAMRCGGCGNKIAADVLSAVLKRIDVGDDPRVVLGCGAGEDAAVHRARPELFGSDPDKLVEVQTVDYFKTFVDDPYLFGRIAAVSAVSDLYAMNARPFSALAIATLPYARGPVQEAMLFELLSGAVHALRQAGVILTGGHTTEGTELALGFAVTGHAEEDRLFKKGNLGPGDRLILTKPIGSGALLAAWMRGECSAAWYDALINSMLTANDRAGRILAEQGVTACTDVTGFGLAGHLVEMLDASKLSARLHRDQVPVFDGFNEVVGRGIVSTLHRDNAKTACRLVDTQDPPAWLFDPQTSGGLLAGVHPDSADELVGELRRAGYTSTAVIGEVLPPGPEGTAFVYL